MQTIKETKIFYCNGCNWKFNIKYLDENYLCWKCSLKEKQKMIDNKCLKLIKKIERVEERLLMPWANISLQLKINELSELSKALKWIKPTKDQKTQLKQLLQAIRVK